MRISEAGHVRVSIDQPRHDRAVGAVDHRQPLLPRQTASHGADNAALDGHIGLLQQTLAVEHAAFTTRKLASAVD